MTSIFNDFFNTQNDKRPAGQIEYLNKREKAMTPVKITATVLGKVQGVGFRYATLQLAQKIGVNGFVRNESDGSVYVEASAKAEIMNDFIDALAKGPAPTSYVDKVLVKYDDSLPNYLDFEIQD